MRIAIIDYGMANLRSVQKAFEQVGVAAEIISRPEEIDRAEKMVLPGVGAFQDAIATLRKQRTGRADPPPYRSAASRSSASASACKCFSTSATKTASTAGLGVLRGKCVRFDVDARWA